MDTIKHLNVELTDYCNQACQYCFNSCNTSGEHNSFSIAQWKSILEKLKFYGLESVHITGGEPFTHPNVIDFIQLIFSLDIQVSILSNGYNIEKYSKSHGEILKRLHHAQISLDSLDNEYLSRLRGYENALDDAVNAIISLRNLGVAVEISTVDIGNKEQVDEIIKFSELVDCHVIIRKIEDCGKAKNKFQSAKDLKQLIQKATVNCDFYLPSERLKGAELGYWTISSKGEFLPRSYVNNNIEYKIISEIV